MTDLLTQLPPLRDIVQKYELNARKSLGQNFLLDLNLTGKIARVAGPLEDHTIIEVGPGPGGLTRALLSEGATRLIVIEKDERCLPALEDIGVAAPGRLEIIKGDALKTDLTSLCSGPTKIVANLPYNIATPLMIGWLSSLTWPPFYASLTLMVQKEVAERIVALPRTKAYGRLSVISQWRTDVKKLFDVPASAFTPAPKVTSSIIQFTPKCPVLEDVELKKLEAITQAAFGQRRKMLRASLKSVSANPQALLEQAGITETRRAEEIDIEGFCRLAKLWQD
jgi:16S rRNA (adenine1518-N6/adenine1519-N6)-dimethyltransferase